MARYLIANQGETEFVHETKAGEKVRLGIGQNAIVELDRDEAKHLNTVKWLLVAENHEPPAPKPDEAKAAPADAEPTKPAAKK